jgi:uncharacterized protein YjiS (DUF1127 family)
MTTLNGTSSDSVIPVAFKRSLRFLTIRLARRINDWVTAVIAHREQQAQLFILRGLSDRDLKDFGLNRSQIGEGVTEAATARSRSQRSRK